MIGPPVDPRIVAFIHRHHVLTLATSHKDEPWCAHCFYAYHADTNRFLFASDLDTRHIADISHNCYVGAAIHVESKVVGRLQGLQIQGVVTKLDGEKRAQARKIYVRTFPYTAAHDLCLWQLDVMRLKYTDNHLGFGKKLHWSRSPQFDSLLTKLKGLEP